MVAALAEGTPVMYNSVVNEVRYCASGVAVRTDSHEFRGEGSKNHFVIKCDSVN